MKHITVSKNKRHPLGLKLNIKCSPPHTRPIRKNHPDRNYFMAKTEMIFYLFCAIKIGTKMQENTSFCVKI